MMKKGLNMTKKQKRILLISIFVFLLLMGGITIFFLPLFNQMTQPEFQKSFQQWVSEQSWKGYVFLLAVQFLQVVIAFIPGEPVELLAGFVYGPWGGLLLCLFGSITASAFVFLLVRRFGNALVHKLFGRDRLEEFSFLTDSKKIEIVVFLLFLIPGTPKDLLTYIAGASPIRLRTFLALSSLARIPSVITSTFVGANVGQGDWSSALLIFLLTAAVGIFSILFKDKLVNYCSRLSKRSKKE